MHIRKKLNFLLPLLFIFNLCRFSSDAQPSKAAKGKQPNTPIVILDDDFIQYLKTDSGDVTKFIGHVKMAHNADTFYADSAVYYKEPNKLEAWGHVAVIEADGTQAFSDYLRYEGNPRIVYMKKNVVLSDRQNNHLWSDNVSYNMVTKTGEYFENGTLVTESTTITSHYGRYNMESKDAYFHGNVIVTDPQYSVTSEELHYNTNTDIVLFTVPSVITNNNSVLKTAQGWYNNKTKLAHFTDRSSLEHGSQYIISDTLDYDKNTGWGKARSRVIAIDHHQKATLYCGYAEYNENSEQLLAVKWPVMKLESDSTDIRYYKADTFFSEPIANLELEGEGQDSLQQHTNDFLDQMQEGKLIDSAQWKHSQIEGNGILDRVHFRKPTQAAPPAPADSGLRPAPQPKDTTAADSTVLENITVRPQDSVKIVDTSDHLFTDKKPERIKPGKIRPSDKRQGYVAPNDDDSKPRYFVGYHHVLVYSDSFQGKCDSVRYSEADSLLRMYEKPVLWARNSQINGDTIYAFVDSSEIHEAYIPKNGIIISRSGPEKAGMYDQVQGNRIHAFFVKNEMDSLTAYPNAQTIYYSKDDSDAYIGVSQASSDRLRIQFRNRKISRIYYISDFKQEMTPMAQVEPVSFRLSRFEWLDSLRPKSVADLLTGATDFQKEQLLKVSTKEPPETHRQPAAHTKKKARVKAIHRKRKS